MDREHVVLPSDMEQLAAEIEKGNYTKFRSGKVRTYTPEEITELAKTRLECRIPLSVIESEKRWNWLLESKGCALR